MVEEEGATGCAEANNEASNEMFAQVHKSAMKGSRVTLTFRDVVMSESETEPTSNELILMVGLPFSGKSEWAKSYNSPVVRPDAIRLALHGQKFVAEAEPMVWTVARLMVKSLFHAGHRRVVLDACNISRARRNEWKSHMWRLRFVHVLTPIDTCLERAVQANQPEMHRVIERMYHEWEPFREGTDVLYIGRNGPLMRDAAERDYPQWFRTR